MPEKSSKPIIKKTGDGSTSLYSPTFDQLYHNPNGAVAESRHVFFETNGLFKALEKRSSLHIFEVGFGTGLNLLLTLDYLRKMNLNTKIAYYSVEAFPIDADITEDFEFADEPGLQNSLPMLRTVLQDIYPGMNRIQLTDQLSLHFWFGFFDDLFEEHDKKSIINHKIDFIFQDAFSPDVNKELWTPDVFKKLASISNDDAVLSTYCAASAARAAMAVAGWKIARARGALGKREMTLASLNADKLVDFKRVNEKRLAERFEKGDFE
ncbi:tRNA (5-methylaminomethyl-2-thiouridine)(34)-methyltransferase MnmD [Rhodohalobacter sulfatireducens]|uniref:tRNA (5-methylaminomethyl-2-thiouridine)(34)-methyltransferase MnmD n=1 Tax=Rhodohalobacter sulfatireducens TaxID=2911366 RepID=A0ABS9KE58_9BACT|nr:tRNA (5-methylaminomethyl-2-thiouridine)(34)-methyltransferase MnmD [Rhodohalobacter sulfatireducens]MCG2589144.1 tRNA (5-methylaminomethyl-2-thiouridine)(34)-methyltransferase MnmD [Rhodohalobacter sulfatireducens]